jgi:thymidylate synthase
MNNLDSQYQLLLQEILDKGVRKSDRTGTGTISLFGKQIRHKMNIGFPLLTTKKMHFKSIVTELLWFLRGDTNIKYLVDNDCNIWNGDSYQNYLKNSSTSLDGVYLSKEEFIYHVKNNKEWGEKWGELGPIYGKQWREWGTGWFETDKDNSKYEVKTIDQIQNLIDEIKTNPDSRRLMVNAWNVGELDQMVLPPCHYGFQIYTRRLEGEEMWTLLRRKVGDAQFHRMVEHLAPFGGGLSEELEIYNIPKRAISLMWNQRSVDTFLGLPFNIASYGLLLEIIAREVNMMPDELIGNLGDVHLYTNHTDQAKEQIARKSFRLPTLKINEGEPSIINETKYWKPEDFTMRDYQSHPQIKAPLSN